MIAILSLILSSLYFFLPAYFANMAPVIFKKINPLYYPIDFNKKIKNKPLLGKNKTWGGLILGVLAGVLIFFLQKIAYQFSFFQKYSLINYPDYSLLLGFLLGFGALAGDLVKSFFKRRMELSPGKSWFPFDQIDYVLGALIFSAPLYFPPLAPFLVILIASPFLHILTNLLGYYLKIKKTKF